MRWIGMLPIFAAAMTACGRSASPTADTRSAQAVAALTMGETTVLASDDNGNANLLIAQQASLPQSATLQSLSFYVTTAAGKLRLGVYDASGPGGGPGAKIAETAEITPASGWNTANVLSPASLAAGTYWLAYFPSSNSLGFRKAGAGSCRFYALAYGPMPATFSTAATTIADHWSFYGTLSAVPAVSVAVLPQVLEGSTQAFTALVGPSGAGVTWSVQEPGGGTITPSGLYTAPMATGTFHVVATSAADPTRSSSLAVAVGSPAPLPSIASFAVAPSTVSSGGSATLSATYSGGIGAVDQGVGALASGGSVTVSPSATTTYTLTVTGNGGATASQSVTLTVTPAAPVTVSISPLMASLQAGGTQVFSTTVSNTTNTSVVWSVQEAAGGTVTSNGTYTAPTLAGIYHVVATSVADPSKSGTATVSVTATPAIAVSISPAGLTLLAGASATLSAIVTGTTSGQSNAVTWSVTEAGGGTVSSSGVYTAPVAEGTYHVVATSVADTSKSATATVTVSALAILSADRRTTWSPGVPGGIPARSTVCATVTAASCGSNGAAEASGCIQAAIDTCPAGQVVQLSAGTFTINSGHFVLVNKGITLRGAGPAPSGLMGCAPSTCVCPAGATCLRKTNGANPDTEAVSNNPSPLIIVGPSQFSNNTDPKGIAGSSNLTADGVKGATSITVANTTGFSAGQIVLLDEASGAGWQTDPQGRGQIWAAPDWRVVWQKHNPSLPGIDDFAASDFPTTPGSAGQWFSRLDRPTAEVKQIDHITGSTVFFTTPIHILYRTSHAAQLSFYGPTYVSNAGVENLSMIGGDNGNLRFNWSSQCWAKNVENTVWHDEGFSIENSFRTEIREFFVHDAAWAQPGGGGYAISLAQGSAEVLIEDGISVRANKVMVSRSSGAGSVVGYNYVDMGYINTNGAWIEIGLNASHMVGPHHVLFEGNYGFNGDSDDTHGNSIYHTYYRNYLRGIRAAFANQAGGTIDDANQPGNGPRRCVGSMAYTYWMSFLGNVLGAPGAMSGWSYEVNFASGNSGIWMLGWDGVPPYLTDAKVASTALRDGNYDYVTNSVTWDPADTLHALPNSLYLSAKPAFFNAGSGYTWPWVNPLGADDAHRIGTLPAKARYDAGTPFKQP